MNNEFKEALSIILGDKSIGTYIAYMFFCFLGVILSLRRSAKRRNPESQSTPKKFSWRFLLWDNLTRALFTLIVMFIILRAVTFPSEWVLAVVGLGFFLSLNLDLAIDFLEQRSRVIKSLLRMPREKVTKKLNDETGSGN